MKKKIRIILIKYTWFNWIKYISLGLETKCMDIWRINWLSRRYRNVYFYSLTKVIGIGFLIWRPEFFYNALLILNVHNPLILVDYEYFIYPNKLVLGFRFIICRKIIWFMTVMGVGCQPLNFVDSRNKGQWLCSYTRLLYLELGVI